MKKLTLLSSLTFFLIGCVKDRNLDGQVTISDFSLGFQDYLIPFGEPVINSVNLFINSGLGNFLELNTIYPSDSLLSFVSFFAFLILIFIEGGILYLVFNVMKSWIGDKKISWLEAKGEFQQNEPLGRMKKTIRFVRRIYTIIWTSALGFTIASFIVYAIICSLTSLEYNYN